MSEPGAPASLAIACRDWEQGRCRSCGWIELPYAAQLQRKQERLAVLLAGLVAEQDWEPPCASELTGFRNKAKMAIGGSVQQPTLGLLDATGRGVDLGDCPLYPESIRAAFPQLRRFLIEARVPPYELATRSGEGKYLLLTEAPGSAALLLRCVLRSREAQGRIEAALPGLLAALPALQVVSLNLLPGHQALLEGEVEIPLTAQRLLPARINGVDLYLAPRAFLQTNTEVAAALYRQACDWLQPLGPRSVWDLYCGIGAFALHLAGPGREVTGVESAADAVAAAQAAAARSAFALRFIAADAAEWAAAQPQSAEAVIVNPPRRGLGAALCARLAADPPRWLVYSSCNPESLRRDLAALSPMRVRAARLFDMFPHTAHCEVAVLLEHPRPIAS